MLDLQGQEDYMTPLISTQLYVHVRAPKAVAEAMMAAQQRKQKVLDRAARTPTFRPSKRGPEQKATPLETSTPTPTPGLKHSKADAAEHLMGSSKKALFQEMDDQDSGLTAMYAYSDPNKVDGLISVDVAYLRLEVY